MLWIWITLLTAALLAWLLIALRRYERESAAAALAEVEQLREELEALAVRVQHLEAIAAADQTLSVSELSAPELSAPELSAPEEPSSLSERSVSSDKNTPQRG